MRMDCAGNGRLKTLRSSGRPRRSRLLSLVLLLAAVVCIATIPGSFIALSSVPAIPRESASAFAVGAAPNAEGSFRDLLFAALLKAWKSGSAGFFAGGLQVIAFMWLRTAMNYQYKFGGSLAEVLTKLYAEGGIGRLYQGIFPWAIFQAPLSRFGDVAANDLVLGVMTIIFPSMPVGFTTFIGSMSAASWRILITPVDTCKTVLQTDGNKGFLLLKEKVRKGGLAVLWSGCMGNYMANVVGTYPWFVAFNFLQKTLPMPDGLLMILIRSAFCGAVASSISDVTSNSIRVIKTKKQTHADANVGYAEAAREVIKTDGLSGILVRGLGTRIFTNILQGAFFTVLWKYLSNR